MSKTPLIFLPGLLCDAELWGHQLTHLQDLADMQVADFTQDDNIPALAQRVLASAPPRFAIAGLSMGGYVAQEIMRQAPDRVIKLALVDTSFKADAPEQSERRKMLIEMANHGKFKGVTPKLLPIFLHPIKLRDHNITQTVMDMAERTGKEAFIRQQTAIMGRPDGRNDLPKITCPTLVVCGREDILTPLDLHQEMTSLIPNAKLVIIEEAGHLPPIEQPHATTAVLRYWLL